jgi:hypothetical protein
MGIEDLIFPGIGAGLGLLSGVWWFKMWVRSVNKKLDWLNLAVMEIKAQAAGSVAIESRVEGQIEQLSRLINETNKSVGKNSGSLEKLWGFMETKYASDLPKRLSDN